MSKIKLIIIIPCIMGTLFFWLLASNPNFSIIQYLRTSHPNLFPIIRNIVWELDKEIPNVGKNIKAPLMELKLSRKDLAHFDNLYQKYENPEYGLSYYQKNNTWRKAKLRYNNKNYNIRIKAQGAAPTSHRKNQFISFTVKILNNKNINNSNRFNLIIRERIQPDRLLNIYLAKINNLIYQNYIPIRLKINGWKEKLYFLEDRMSSDLMEAKYNSSLKIFRGENYNGVSSDKDLIINSYKPLIEKYYDDTLHTVFEEIFDKNNLNSEHRSAIYNRYIEFNNYLNNPNKYRAAKFFNIDYISSFEAIRMIRGFDGHGSVKGNLVLSANWSDGKYYPAIVRDHVPSLLSNSNIIESQLHKFSSDLPFLIALNLDDEIRQNKYKKIYNLIINDMDTLSNALQLLEETFERLHYRGWLSQIFRKMKLSNYTNILSHNCMILKKYIENFSPEVSFFNLNNYLILKIKPNSMAEISIDKIKFENQLYDGHTNAFLYLKKDNDYILIQKNDSIKIDANISNIKLNMNNMFDGINNQMQKDSQDYFLIINTSGISQNDPLIIDSIHFSNIITSDKKILKNIKKINNPFENFDKLIKSKEYVQLPKIFNKINNNTLVINPGTYNIDSNLIVPENYNLIIKSNVKLLMAPHTMLIGNKNLIIEGTKLNPVLIKGSDINNPFASIGFNGDGNTIVEINHLLLAHGSEGWNEGIYFSGAMSLHNHKYVKINNSSFINNAADDGLNIKYAKNINISNSNFENNFADQIDLDYCIGYVTNSTFNNHIGKDSNGDGLDISGSNLIINKNSFKGFNDKGISIGEDSRAFIINNDFINNNQGMAIKDQSIVNIKNNNFINSIVDINIYQKKSIFGGGILNIEKIEENNLKIKKDAVSKIINNLIDINDNYLQTIYNRKKHFIGY